MHLHSRGLSAEDPHAGFQVPRSITPERDAKRVSNLLGPGVVVRAELELHVLPASLPPVTVHPKRRTRATRASTKLLRASKFGVQKNNDPRSGEHASLLQHQF